MRRLALILVTALVSLTFACGGEATPTTNANSEDSAGSRARPTPKTAGAERSGSGEESAQNGSTDAGDADAEPVESDAPDKNEGGKDTQPTAAPKNTMAIDTSVDPACVKRRDTATLTIKTEKFSDVSFGVSFADGENHGLYGLGKTDAKGVYVYAFVVSAEAAPGEAKVLVAAMNAATQHGGQSQDEFEVAATTCP